MEHDLRLRQMNIGRLAPPLGVVGEPPSNVSRLRPLIGDNLAHRTEINPAGGRRTGSNGRPSQLERLPPIAMGVSGQFPSFLYLSKWTLIWPMHFGS